MAEHPQAELLIWNHRLGHLPYSKIKILGVIPKRLANTKPHKCEGFIYEATTNRPWSTKWRQINYTQMETAPGQCVSVDQLESPIPGFLSQLKDRLTKQRYRSATVFVGHFICISYVHIHISLTLEEASKAKQYFKAYSRKQGVIIRHYYADNRQFTNNAFINSVNAQGKTIPYCGVNAHF